MADTDESQNKRRGYNLTLPRDDEKLTVPLRPRASSDASDTDLFGLAFLDESDYGAQRQ